jgi:hypothetical protein
MQHSNSGPFVGANQGAGGAFVVQPVTPEQNKGVRKDKHTFV